MHEMGIAQELAGIALDSIPDDIKDPKVKTVHLKIGRLASVVEHSLSFCFEIIAKDTPLEGAQLDIETIPVRAQCKDCRNEWEVTGPIFTCPSCSEGEVRLLSGREIEIFSLELADD